MKKLYVLLLIAIVFGLAACTTPPEGRTPKYNDKEVKNLVLAPPTPEVFEIGDKLEIAFDLVVPEKKYQIWVRPNLPENYSAVIMDHGFTMEFTDSPRYSNQTVSLRRTIGLTYNSLKDNRLGLKPTDRAATNYPPEIVVTNLTFTLKNLDKNGKSRVLVEVPVEYTWPCVKSNDVAKKK